MKISIVTAYYNRKNLLYTTLKSIEKSKHKDDVEIIIVDDASKENERIEDFKNKFKLNIKIIRIEPSEKTWINPCIPFNIGFKNATGDIVIIQNPECLHMGDIIDYTLNNMEENTYLNFACYSVDGELNKKINNLDYSNPSVLVKINLLLNPMVNRAVTRDGETAWYNHSVYRPHMLHFCSAILKTDLDKLGGFDERYAHGIAYDDNEFLARIKRMNMNIKIVDSPFVIHQYHGTTDYAGKQLLVQKNANIYHNQTLKETKIKNV